MVVLSRAGAGACGFRGVAVTSCPPRWWFGVDNLCQLDKLIFVRLKVIIIVEVEGVRLIKNNFYSIKRDSDCGS